MATTEKWPPEKRYPLTESQRLGLSMREVQRRIVDVVLRDKLIPALELDDEVKENELTP
jgi:hypothetical protein